MTTHNADHKQLNQEQTDMSADSTAEAAPNKRRQSPAVVDKFVIRLPQGLRNQIRELSESNRRSMNSEIIMVLEQYIQQQASTASDELADIAQARQYANLGRSASAPAPESSTHAAMASSELSLDEKLKSLPPEKKAALLSLLT